MTEVSEVLFKVHESIVMSGLRSFWTFYLNLLGFHFVMFGNVPSYRYRWVVPAQASWSRLKALPLYLCYFDLINFIIPPEGNVFGHVLKRM